MDCKTDIVSLYTMGRIAGILRLVRKSRHPDDVTGLVLADLVYYFLEIKLHIGKMGITTAAERSVSSLYVYRLICKLEHYPAVVLELRMLRYYIPYIQKECLITVIELDVLRRYSRRTHHHIKSLVYCIFCHRHENFVKILSEAGFRESLMTFISDRRLRRVITPIRIHVHPDEVHFPSCSEHFIDHALIIGKTCRYIIITPRIFIKKRTVCLSEAM